MSIQKCFNDKCPSWDPAEPDKCAHPWKQMSECEDAILEKVMPVKEKSFYLEELKSTECQCGREKNISFSFCWDCWKQLPDDMQKALYLPIGHGYEEAYEASIKWLDEN